MTEETKETIVTVNVKSLKERGGKKELDNFSWGTGKWNLMTYQEGLLPQRVTAFPYSRS